MATSAELVGDALSPTSARARRRYVRMMLSPDIAFPGGLLLAVLACLAWPSVYPIVPPVGGNVLYADLPWFSPGHFLGTDMNGNDVWSRLLYGGRTSLQIALAVNLIGLFAGSTLGAVGAWRGGRADTLIMRLLDVLLAFPSLILVVAVAQALGPGKMNTIWALTFFSVPAFARVARAATLRLREQPFMMAARLCGTGTVRILFRHIAPNIVPQLATFALLGMGIVINIEGAVSFLGLGVPLPLPSWGSMIYQGQVTLMATPTLVLLPSTFLFATVLAFNLLGQALRERWNKA